MNRRRLCRLVALLAVAGTGCGQASPPALTAASLPTLSVEQVYAKVQAALAANGIYHERSVRTTDPDRYAGATTIERWSDVKNDRVRESTVSTPPPGEGTATQRWTNLIIGGETFSSQGAVQSVTCYGANAATSAVLGCRRHPARAQAHVETQVLGKRAVYVVVLAYEMAGEESTTRVVRRKYVDGSTFLPVGAREDGSSVDGPASSYRTQETHEGAFLSRSSLSKDFLELSGAGLARPDPVASLPPGSVVYWLGARWTPQGGLPPVQLEKVEPPSGYDAILYYTTVEQPHGAPVISIHVWRPEAWAQARVQVSGQSCDGVGTVTVAGGSARLLCPEPLRVTAVVTLPDAKLIVDAASGFNDDGETVNPFGTVAALRHVLNALRRR